MLNLNSKLCLTLVVASLLTGCGKYGLAKMDDESATGAETETGSTMSAEQWLSVWQAHQAKQTSAAPTPRTADPEPEAASQPTTFASGVSLGAERDARPTSNKRSGSRLRARVVLTDEGQQTWVGWRDQDRNEDCEFQQDAEGALRCLPTHSTRDVYFADAECTVRVAAVAAQDEVDYALQSEGNQCAIGVRVYPVRAALQATVSVFKQDSRGRCKATATPDAVTLHAVGDEVPLTEFVAARQGIEGTDARIKAVGLVADDGTIAVNGFFDSELNTSCAWQGTNHTACVPQTTEVSTFADELCSQPLLQPGRNACAPEVTFGAAREADGCEMAYYQPGEAFQGSTVYDLTEESYQSREIAADEATAMQLGVRVSRSEFAPGKLERLAGATTRLSAQHWTTPDGGVWFSNWYDNVLDAACSFVPSGNNVWQCLPTDTGNQVMYADAACTQPITETQAVDGCGTSVAPPRFVTEQVTDATGKSVLQVRRVLGGRPYLATAYQKTAAGCEAQAIDDNRSHFDLSQPLPVNSFVRGQSNVL